MVIVSAAVAVERKTVAGVVSAAEQSYAAFDSGGSITLASAVMASECLRLQQRWQRGWQRLVMVSVTVVAAFVLEAFPSVVQL